MSETCCERLTPIHSNFAMYGSCSMGSGTAWSIWRNAIRLWLQSCESAFDSPQARQFADITVLEFGK